MLQISKATGTPRYFDETPQTAARIKAMTDSARETALRRIVELPYDVFYQRNFKVPSATGEGTFFDVCFYPDTPFCTCEYFLLRKKCQHIEAVKLFVELQTIVIPHAGKLTTSKDNKRVSYFTAPDGKARWFDKRDIISDERWSLIVPAWYLDTHPILREVA